MAVKIYFERGSSVVQLPVNPPDIRIVRTGKNSVQEIVKLGEVNVLRMQGLAGCTIESFFPENISAPYVTSGSRTHSPSYYVDFFEKALRNKQYLRFMVSDMDINMLMAVESFEYGQDAGDPDTHYTIALKEWKKYSARTIVIQEPPAPTSTEDVAQIIASEPERPKTGFAVGDNVQITGKWWHDSYGGKPFGNANNRVGRINIVAADTTRAYRFHVTSPTGGAWGWVAENQLTHA